MLEKLYELTYEIVAHFYEEYEKGVAEGKEPLQHFLSVYKSMGPVLSRLERQPLFTGVPRFTFVRVGLEVGLEMIQLLDKKDQQQILRILLDEAIDRPGRFGHEGKIYVTEMLAQALLNLEDEE